MSTFTNSLIETKTMVKRNLWKSLGNTDRLMENIVSPILIMLLFVYVLGGSLGKNIGTDYINYIVPGILLVCIGQCSAATATGISTDIQQGIVDRFRSMPISLSCVLNGHVFESVIRTTFSLVLTFAVAILFGFRPDTFLPEILITIGILLLFTVSLTWISVAFGLFVKGPEGTNSLVMYTQVLTFLSSGFISTDTLPKPLRIFSENQPITPIIETIRRLLFNQPLENYLFLSVCWCIGLLIISYILSLALYKRRVHA